MVAGRRGCLLAGCGEGETMPRQPAPIVAFGVP
jgi:hypothetical protein